MAQSYTQAIAAAKERYKTAMNESAADALMIVQDHGRPLQTVCKDIAGDGWQALRAAARRMEETAGQSAEERGRRREAETRRKAIASATSVLKSQDDTAKVIAKLPPAALDDLYHEVRLARAGEDRTPPARKAAAAAASRSVEPIRRAFDASHKGLFLSSLADALEELKQATDADWTPAEMARAEKATNDIANLLMEVRFSEEARA